MADDARISTGFPRHPKTIKLRRRLNEAGVLGLMYLILWCGANRYDGDLSGLSIEDIEIAAEWNGTAGALVSALVEVGYLDGDDGSYTIHDWADHQPYIVARPAREQAARNAANAKWSGKTPAERSEAARHAANAKWGRQAASDMRAPSTDDASVVHAESMPPTLPDPTNPSLPENTLVRQRTERESLDRFLALWNDNRSSLPEVHEITPERAKKLKARLRNPKFESSFVEAVAKATKSEFLSGGGEKGFKASFDWMIEDDTNYLRVLEGNFEGRRRRGSDTGGAFRSGARYGRKPDLEL